MLDENIGVLDERTWQIVHSFFHPEENVCQLDSIDGMLGALFGELSRPIGISSSPPPGTVTASGFYSGRSACLVWTADENVEEKFFWRAQVIVVTGTGFDDSIVVSITDARGESIDAAMLILLSSTLNVSQGKAYYSLSEFQRHLSNTDVALIFPNGRRIPGALKLGENLL